MWSYLGRTRQSPRLRWWATRVCATSAAGVAAYEYDRHLQASAVARTLRAFKDIAIICADYKLNFRPERGIEYLNLVHQRAARRLLLCCKENGGLFIKFGQSIAVQSSLLPPPFREELRMLYDNAPSVSVEKIAPVIERGFPGLSLDDLFVDFSPQAVASASVAQVHTARLRSDPTKVVAVKIQKPEIKLQINWDLFAFRTCAHLVELAFDVPIMWSIDEVERRLREELDFEREASNSELANRDLNTLGDRWLRNAIYIPKVYWETTRKEVLTTEWADGTSLVHPSKLTAEGWSSKEIMQKMVALFAFQIFVAGNVHGDPHPGNMLVRQNPNNSYWREPQLVLLDHGLYVRESKLFRRQYAEFWRSAMLGNKSDMARIARSWGISDAGMFSTMVSLRPPILGSRHQHRRRASPDSSSTGEVRSGRDYEQQMEVKRRAVAALRESSSLPPELVFVSRNMNIVRANNQSLGTPVNRVQILGQYAALGLRGMLIDEALSPNRRYDATRGVIPRRDTLLSRLAGVVVGEWSYVTFRLALWATGIGMAVYGAMARIWSAVTGKPRIRDIDGIMDEAMRRISTITTYYFIALSQLSISEECRVEGPEEIKKLLGTKQYALVFNFTGDQDKQEFFKQCCEYLEQLKAYDFAAGWCESNVKKAEPAKNRLDIEVYCADMTSKQYAGYDKVEFAYIYKDLVDSDELAKGTNPVRARCLCCSGSTCLKRGNRWNFKNILKVFKRKTNS
ncbi:hypothetical protein H4R26_001668 [Coemansia thaxteri]|uniref:ABC1 atypical kinase-like domain-containing protein n=1 Tax=Coemansia thaxteri TaxID=2663907 RepID=A0A9W8BMG5_9FUNG|nr:hypothetical protein H4R26_001668 [Coemansia thaxteri]